MVCPAIVTAPDRELVLLLAPTSSVSVAPPLPLVGDTVTQEAFDDVDHEQPDGVVSVTDEVPPAAAIETDVCDTVYVQAMPA
jgi:hypothetical protein